MTGREGQRLTIPERIAANAASSDVGDFLRLIHPGRPTEVFSYAGLLAEAGRWSAFYRQGGMAAGDRVVVILQHSADLYATYLGALLGGVVPAMFAFPSPKFSQEEYFRTIGLLLANARPRMLVTYPELRERLRSQAGAIPESTAVCVPTDVQPGECKIPDAGACDPEATAFVQYSSGTTGIKKGVAISHRALLWQVDRYAEAIRLSPDDTIVSWLPLYHDMGLIACFFLPLVAKVRLAAMSPFDWVRRPAMWLQAVSDFRGTLSWLPNFAYSFLARNVTDDELAGIDLSSLRGVVNCSEPITADSQERFVRRFSECGFRREALAGSYAMAENTFAATSAGFGDVQATDWIEGREFAGTGRAVAVADSAPQARAMVSSGRALPDTHIEIVAETGEPVGDRQLGEIVLRSPCLLSEYHANPEETARAVRDDRYFTGDLGYLADGELYVTGRKKDMIIIGGQNIYPQDIEEMINDVPGVIPGRCVALGMPDAETGTESLVVLAETDRTDPAALEAVRRNIYDRIASGTDVVAGDIRLLEHMWLRKSSAGKISRTINRDRYLEMVRKEREADEGSGARSVEVSGDVESSVRRCVRQVLDRTAASRGRSVGDDEPLISSGLIDSFGLVTLINLLQAECGVVIPAAGPAAPKSLDSIRNIIAMVKRLKSGPREEAVVMDEPLSADGVPMEIPGDRPARRGGGFWSRYYRWVFWRHGIRCGGGMKVLGRLILRFDGDPRNITIGRNVTLMPMADLKIRGNGKIILHDGVVLDTMTRLVAANEARIELGDEVQVGMGTIINAGADVLIGRRTSIAGFCTIIASEHKYQGREPVMTQGYNHDPVYIGEDVWMAANAFVGRGSRIGHGAVLGAKTVVTGNIPAYAVVMGNPGRVVKFRG